jgi:hypothetical protein
MYFIIYECITYDYTKIYSSCKANSFYCWFSEDGPQGPKHVRPFKYWSVYIKLGHVVAFFSLPNPSSHIMALGLTQPLTEMSTRSLPGGKGWPVRKADNLTTIGLGIQVTLNVWEDTVSVLLMGMIYDVRRCMPLRWSQMAWHIHTKFHDDRFRNSSNIVKDFRFRLVNGFIDHVNTRLIITLYISLTHRTSVLGQLISTSRFLATDFNTGTTTVSLTYTLQISHTVFFSQPHSCN